MAENKGKYYLTTAIAYTSGKPHIGNVYEIVLADAIARFKRLEGYDVWFQTGTDEHGQKNELKAAAAGVSPKEYVDKIAGIIKGQFDLMNVSYDYFSITRRKSRRSLKSFMTRETFTKAPMRGFTAQTANPSSPKASLWTANARTAGGKSTRPRKKPTSLR